MGARGALETRQNLVTGMMMMMMIDDRFVRQAAELGCPG
jgi:hypothetical protein